MCYLVLKTSTLMSNYYEVYYSSHLSVIQLNLHKLHAVRRGLRSNFEVGRGGGFISDSKFG